MFTVSTVLGEKASDVEQSRGAGAKLPGRRPPAHWTVRGAGEMLQRVLNTSTKVFCQYCPR